MNQSKPYPLLWASLPVRNTAFIALLFALFLLAFRSAAVQATLFCQSTADGVVTPCLGAAPSAVILTATKRDQLVIDANQDNVASPGDTIEYTVRLHNSGDTVATSLVFSDLPDGNTQLLNNSVTTTQGVVAVGNVAGDSDVLINIGDLAANSTVTLTLRVMINSALPAGVSKIANQGVVSGGNVLDLLTDDPDSPAQTDATETAVVAAPKITAIKTDTLIGNNGTARPSDTLEYQITISNQGNQEAANLIFYDTPDINTQLLVGSVQSTQGTVIRGNTPGDTNVQVNLGNLPVGQSVVITFRVVIHNILLQPGVTQIDNQGFVTGNNIPTEPTDDPQTQAPDDPTVTPLLTAPRLELFKGDTLLVDADQNGLPSPGDTLVYNVSLLNNGNSVALGVVFLDTPDVNSKLVVGSVVTGQGTVVKGNTLGDITVQVDVGSINSGASVSISFRVLIDKPVAAGITQIRNQGFAQSTGQPTEPTDDPQTLQDDDPTITSITAAPLVNAPKQVRLFLDADNNGVVSPSDTLEYQITLANNGNQTASNVTFTDLPDSNTKLVVGSVQSSQGTVVKGNTAGDASLQINVGAVAVGQNVIITFRVTVNTPLANGVTQVSNQGFVNGANFPSVPTDDPNTPSNADPTASAVTATPLLEASKRGALFRDNDGNGVPTPGDILRYQVAILNTGNSAASGVIFIDKLDPNTSLVVGSVNSSAGVVISGNSPGDSEIRIQIGDLAGLNGAVTISYQAAIDQSLPASVVQISNQGIVTSEELPGVPTDDPTTPAVDDPTVTPVRVVPSLSASKQVNLLIDSDNDGIADPEETLRYAVTIVNKGNALVTNVIFSDTIDAITTLVPNSVQSSLGTVISGNSASDRTIEINIGSLAAGGKVDITYVVKINSPLPAGKTSVVNQGVVRSNELADLRTDDPTRGGSSDPTVILVVGAAQLEMLKQDTHWVDADKDGKITLNDILKYDIRIINTGNSATGVVTLRDTPDAKTTLVTGSVQASQGTVLKGNTAGDSQVEVNLGVIPPKAIVTISFQARINVNTSGVINNQAQASYIDPLSSTGLSVTVNSDDPETTGKLNDPTSTAIDGPTASEETPEPTAPAAQGRAFFPLIKR